MSLRTLRLFLHLTDEEFGIIRKFLKRRNFPPGEVVIKEGEMGRSLYIIEKGTVRITRHITLKVGERWGESEKAMDTLDAEQVGFFGEMSLVSSLPRSATITTVTNCTLYELTSEDFEIIIEKHPRIALKLLKEISTVLAERVHKLNSTVIKLTTAISILLSSVR